MGSIGQVTVQGKAELVVLAIECQARMSSPTYIHSENVHTFSFWVFQGVRYKAML